MQVRYKQDGKKEAGGSLYHHLPETTETRLAKGLRDVYSEVSGRQTPSGARASLPCVGTVNVVNAVNFVK